MIAEEMGIRIYSREYCLELFPAKWKEYSPILPWMLVAGGFAKALEAFYRDGVFVAKLLGPHNINAATKAFVMEDRSFDLGVTLSFQGGVKLNAGPNRIRLLRQADARGKFRDACAALGFKWESVAEHLTGLLDKLYHEQLILAEADVLNAEVLRLALEDDEAVDLKIRINA